MLRPIEKVAVSRSNFKTIKQWFRSKPQHENKGGSAIPGGQTFGRKEEVFPCGTGKKHG